MIRRILLLSLLYTTCWITALSADVITFTFANLDDSTFAVSATGLGIDHANNLFVADNTTGKIIALNALDSGFTGAASSITLSPVFHAVFQGAGANSILIFSLGDVLLSGEMLNNATFSSTYPEGAGAFLSDFLVTHIEPGILTELGVLAGSRIDPTGSVSFTVANAELDDGHLEAELGGGAITVETLPPVPEPSTMLLLGTSLCLAWKGLRRFRHPGGR